MNIKKLQVNLATHYYNEVIDGIYDSSIVMKEKLKKDLQVQAAEIEAAKELSSDEKEQMLSSLGDEVYIAELTTELAGEMMIVALYKTIEIAIKKMATYSCLFTPKQIASFYKIAELNRQLKNKVCDVQGLKHYKAFDELRCINNSVKHNGVPNKDLVCYPNWKNGEKLTKLHIHYRRLKDDVDRFVTELRDEIIKKIP